MTDSVIPVGVEVIMVSPGSEAERVGVQKGDRILVVNGHPVSTLDDYCAARKYSSERLEITVQRAGQVLDLTLNFLPLC